MSGLVPPRHACGLACLLAAALSITVVSAQNPPRPTPRLPPEPNIFLLDPRSPRQVSSNEPHLRDWLAAIENHEPGVRDDPMVLVSQWDGDRLAHVVSIFEGSLYPGEKGGAKETRKGRTRRSAKEQEDEKAREALLAGLLTRYGDMARVLKRAVVLHTDIGVSAMLAANQPDVVWRPRLGPLHLGVAMELVEWLRLQDAGDPLPRAWYHATAAFLLARYEISSTPKLVERSLSLFPGDADMLLIGGAAHELLASPRVQEGPDLTAEDRRGSAVQHLAAAERFFRQALAAGPSLVEARVRLGHVLGEMGRHDEALASLNAARTATASDRERYFTFLFIGEEEEALNHPEAARRAYEQALDVMPEAQSAHLALSRMERQSGHRTSAVEAVQRMLRASADDDTMVDPWRVYFMAGGAQHVHDCLREMRELARRPQ